MNRISHLMADGKAEMHIVKQLAYENVNAAYQAAICPFRKKGDINDYIHLCADIGPKHTQGLTLATALQGLTMPQLLVVFQQGKRNE